MSRELPCSRHEEGTVECPATRAIEILQDKWVLHIVHALIAGSKGFNELGREVGGCNPTTLAQRLARLDELGIVTKSVTHEAPVRTSYALTPVGAGLSAVIDAIQSWASDHLAAPA